VAGAGPHPLRGAFACRLGFAPPLALGAHPTWLPCWLFCGSGALLHAESQRVSVSHDGVMGQGSHSR
jgi:hypothetical protein